MLQHASSWLKKACWCKFSYNEALCCRLSCKLLAQRLVVAGSLARLLAERLVGVIWRGKR